MSVIQPVLTALSALSSVMTIASALNPIGKLERALNIMDTATSLFTKMSDAFSKAISQYTVAAKQRIVAEQELQFVLSKTPGMTQPALEFMKQHLDYLQSVTGVDSTTGTTGQAVLASHMNNPNNINLLTEPLYDLTSALFGMNFNDQDIKVTANIVGNAVRGDLTDLSNIPRFDQVISSLSEAEQLIIRFGNESERAALVAQMINGELEGFAQTLASTDIGKINQAALGFKKIKEAIGTELLKVLSKMADYFVEKMPQIEAIAHRLAPIIINIVDAVFSVFRALFSFVLDNWSTIESYLISLGVSILPIIISGAVALLGILASLLAPLLLKVAIIGTIIEVFRRLGVTAEEVVGSIVGGFMFIVASIKNFGVMIYNFFDSVASIIVAAFLLAKIGILGFGSSLLNSVITWISFIEMFADVFVDEINGAVNSVLERFNKFLEKLNSIFNTDWSVDLINESNPNILMKWRDEEKEKLGRMKDQLTSKKNELDNVVQNDLTKINDLMNRPGKSYESPIAAFQQGYSKGSAFVSKFKQFGPSSEDTLPSGPWWSDSHYTHTGSPSRNSSIDKVGEVGKINDTVDVASEDLKLMRELAEIQSIQNFVTLTPTVQMTTGDINSGYDVDKIITRIEQKLEEEFVSVAEGVYA